MSIRQKMGITPQEANGIRLLQGIDYQTLKSLLLYCPVLHCDAGEVLISPHDTDKDLFFILDGQLEIQLDDQDLGSDSYIGHHNFYVITTYNRNVMYALVVIQLGEAIESYLN